MIQRIQSVYLLLAAIALGLMFAFDICQYAMNEGERVFTLDLFGITDKSGEKVADARYGLWLLSLVPITAVILFLDIFMYNNRKKQLKLVHFTYLLEAGAIVLAYFSMEHSLEALPEGEYTVSYGIGWLLPAIAFAFTWLAARGIKKDQKLVDSLDRLR